jgi:hypothetical protein
MVIRGVDHSFARPSALGDCVCPSDRRQHDLGRFQLACLRRDQAGDGIEPST